MSNAIIASYLSKLNNNSIIAFIRSGDIKSEILFKSFGIKKFIFFKKKNFFKRLRYIFLSIKLVKDKRKIQQFCKIKKDNIDLGLPSYDSFIRYTGIPTLNKITPELILFLAEALYAYDTFEKEIKRYNIIHSVQAETAFSPLNIFFQLCLKNKIKVYTRLGTDKFSVRIYDNFSQRYYYRANISQKLLNKVHVKFKKIAKIKIKRYYHSLQRKGHFGQDLRIRSKIKSKSKILNKEKLCKIFGWSSQKKIAVFFFNHLIDVNFHSGPRTIFKDNYSWSDYILKQIPKINNVNWLIKDHPSQPYYKSKLNFDQKIIELEKKHNHIKLFNKSWDPSILKDFIDFAITSHGTAGIEYPSFGIKSLYVENSFYSNVNIIKKISKLEILNKKLFNLNQIQLTKKMISKANTFLFIRYILLQNKCSLINKHDTSRQVNEKEFWEKNRKLIKKFSFEKDELFKMFKIQIENNFRHTVNFNEIPLKINFKNDLSE